MVWNHQLVFDWRQLLQRWSDVVNNSGPGNPCFAKGPLSHLYVGVSENSGTPKSSILIGFSIVNHPICGTPIFGNTHICWSTLLSHSILYPISILEKVSFPDDILSKMSSLLHLIHSIYYWLVATQTCLSPPTWGDDPIWLAPIFQVAWNHQLLGSRPFRGRAENAHYMDRKWACHYSETMILLMSHVKMYHRGFRKLLVFYIVIIIIIIIKIIVSNIFINGCFQLP